MKLGCWDSIPTLNLECAWEKMLHQCDCPVSESGAISEGLCKSYAQTQALLERTPQREHPELCV